MYLINLVSTGNGLNRVGVDALAEIVVKIKSYCIRTTYDIAKLVELLCPFCFHMDEIVDQGIPVSLCPFDS